MGDARDRSLPRRAEDVDVVAVRGERGAQPGRRALDAAVEDEGAGDDQEAHCSGGRGAGAFGGWPETRSDPAAFRMPQLIPRKGDHGPGAFGGWPDTRCDPAAFRMPQLIPPKGDRGPGAFGGWPDTRCDPAAFRMPQLIPRKGDRGPGAFGGWPDTRCDPAAFRMPPFTPPRGTSRPSACRESVDQWEQHGPGGAEAVSLVAAPAGSGPELARLVRALEQAPDRRREPARGPRRHDAPAAVDDLGTGAPHRLDEIVDALVGPRRAEKHNDLFPRDAERRARPCRVVARRVPGVGVARVGEQHATETLGQEARRGRASVGASHEALGRPCPREPVGVGEVERSAGAAPEPGAVQEPELPVVDVEEQRTPTARTREQAETVTRRTRLGRDDEVAVDQREERGQTSKEPRVLPCAQGAVPDAASRGGLPERRAELGTDHLDVPACGQETREQISAAGRGVGEVEGDDPDLHAAGAVTRRPERASSAAA